MLVIAGQLFSNPTKYSSKTYKKTYSSDSAKPNDLNNLPDNYSSR